MPGASVDLGIGIQPDRALRRAKVLITGAEHGQPAARKRRRATGGAVAEPLRFAARGEKCLRRGGVVKCLRLGKTKVITGAEHGQPAARQQGVAVAQPLRFAVRGRKCLRGRCREVFAARLYKPISFPKPLLAVLVYRLVCQPVTLESWVRLPDAALDSDRAPALNSGRNKHRQTAGKHARNHFSAGPIVSFARSVVIIHLSFLRSAESITKHKLFEPGRRTR